MTEVFVVGVGITKFGKFLEWSVKDLTRECVDSALADAGIGKARLNAAFFANATQGAMEGQFMVPGQIALRSMGIDRIPVANVENACASGATAFNLAYAQIRAGMADVVLAVGAEKMYDHDKAKSFSIFDGAWDVHSVAENVAALSGLGASMTPADLRPDENGGRSLFMDIYAAQTKLHMEMFGTTQRQLALVASKNHQHSTLNPMSQYQRAMSVDEVLASRLISWPLTLAMCSPISDGGVAVILCSAKALHHFDRKRAVKVLASVLISGSDRAPQDAELNAGRRAALQAYEIAGIAPQDISVAEVHDAAAFGEVVQTENLGFCEIGRGGELAESGATSLGGRIPVNPSGGLESKGHPIGATGLGQIHELVLQLRGQAGPRQVQQARLAIAENGGGFYGCEEAANCITILGRM